MRKNTTMFVSLYSHWQIKNHQKNIVLLKYGPNHNQEEPISIFCLLFFFPGQTLTERKYLNK